MKSQAQMSVLDGVLSIGVPTLSVLSGVLAHSVRVISVSLTGLENAMMISVEVLSAAVMLWWTLGVILGVGYCNICAVSAFGFPCCPLGFVVVRGICGKFYAQHGGEFLTAGVSRRNPSRGTVSELSVLPGCCHISAGYWSLRFSS